MTSNLSLIVPSAFCSGDQATSFLVNLCTYDHLLGDIIVVDFKSSSEFLDIISKHSKVNILQQSESTGIYGAWQLGLAKITSTHVCFAGIDDCLNPLFISAFLQSDGKDTTTTIYYGDKVLIKDDKHILVRSPKVSSLAHYSFVSCDVPIPGLIFPRFPPSYIDLRFQLAADMNLLLLLLRQRNFNLSYLHFVQVNQNFDGLSNSFKSVPIYLREWRLIEYLHSVKINYFTKLYFYFMILSKRFYLFNFFKRIKRHVLC
ncbi:glycosyltransferase [Parasynechococcus marenigrum]|uniref:Possible glycosyltransferase n=1 Tax=Parasynechococcus marenigrum (strain WH8102) TaxID=84588 RepID=Q7U904_PARMW|nr:glycosyltransferase [Parasynechococcus marenigrum]CAE06970.1 Possible glycosyltransferase [Parasynechococcus marenigrum WH 8102]